MANSNRRRFLKGMGAAAAGSMVGLAGCGGDGGGGTFDVAVAGMMSGPFGVIGEYTRRGVELTADTMGDINGQEIQVHSFDATSPDEGVTQMREVYEEEDLNAVVAGASSSVALAVQEYVHEQGDLVMFACGSLSPTERFWEDAGECQDTFFRAEANLLARNEALARTLVEETPEDATRVAGVVPNYTYGLQTWDAFQSSFEEHRPDVEFVSESTPDFGKGDYQNEIQQTLDADPDIWYTSLWAGDILGFLQQARQFDFFEEIEYAGQGGILMDIMPQLGADMPSMYGVPYWFPTDPDTEEHMDYLEAYDEMFDDGIAVDHDGSRFDGMTLPAFGTIESSNCAMRALSTAADQAGATDADSLIGELEGLEFETLQGTATLRASDHQIEEQVSVGLVGDVDYWQHRGYSEFFRQAGSEVNPEGSITCN
jgi:branched-chain amino acid transport system substrate-binding protein